MCVWKHGAYKMLFMSILSSVCLRKSFLSLIVYALCEAVRFQLAHFYIDEYENICNSSLYHHQSWNMTYKPLFRAR